LRSKRHNIVLRLPATTSSSFRFQVRMKEVLASELPTRSSPTPEVLTDPCKAIDMTFTTDPALQSAIDAVSYSGVMIGHRLILAGDEHALKAEELPAFAGSVIKVRRASGAARVVARQLLQRMGHLECAIPKSPSGAPIWPQGIVGSLAHDSNIAVAAIATRRAFEAIGIDIEPAEMLPPDLLDLVATPKERLRISDDPYRGRLLFVAKEAVYKAVNPVEHVFLDHHDVEIDFEQRKAFVRTGRVVDLRFAVATHLVALALLAQGQ
jgi:4'-phosphopantetheinyl transferase EntD